MSFIKEWIYRLRHNRGFGVQSPAAFFLVTHVLRKSRHPYYIYPLINALTREATGGSSTHARRLFRLTNAIHPQNIFIIDKKCSAAACAIAAARRSVPTWAIVEEAPNSATRTFLSQHTNCLIDRNDALGTLQSLLNKEKKTGLLYIGETPHCAQAVATAIEHCDNHSAIIIEGIKSPKRKKLWKQLVASPQTVVTMDFHKWGILFFNKEYKKQHYTFWFK